MSNRAGRQRFAARHIIANLRGAKVMDDRMLNAAADMLENQTAKISELLAKLKVVQRQAAEDRSHGGRDLAQLAAVEQRMKGQREHINELLGVIERQEKRIMELGG